MDKNINVAPAQPFMNKAQLAKHLGISVRGVEGLMAARKIPYFSLGHRTVRFDLHRVMAALSAFEVKNR
jgi:hypothetical protein